MSHMTRASPPPPWQCMCLNLPRREVKELACFIYSIRYTMYICLVVCMTLLASFFLPSSFPIKTCTHVTRSIHVYARSLSTSLSLFLSQSFSLLSPDTTTLPLIHKKIRLSEDLLSWEHERFSLKRLPAATLSALHSHKDPRRHSMFVGRLGREVD